ncbi:MAG: LytR/AlgR family response regulator transcription factor, partial [Arenimonas sp.]
MTPEKNDSRELLARYLPCRRYFETGFWVVNYLLFAVINSVISILDIERAQLQFENWKPILWELSSVLVGLALVPAIIAFERRYPLYIGVLRKHLPIHILASVVYSIIHVTAMVQIRKLVYVTQGQSYDFGNWPLELGYEYLKDWQTYAGVLFVLALYDLLLLRLQGEARILGTPDDEPELEPTERPERFLVRKLGKEFLIAAAEVEYLQASGNYVNLHLHGRDYPLRSTMAAIEPRMDPNKFVRVHRSYMVNLDFIKEIEPLDTGDARILMKDGSVV